MKYSGSDRRKAENEVIFRKHNEAIQAGFEEIKRIAKEDDQEHLIPADAHTALRFYCECSDENCRLRILLTPSKYKRLHQKSAHFVIAPGHEAADIEKVVKQADDYFVVEKKSVPAVASMDFGALNQTDVNNV